MSTTLSYKSGLISPPKGGHVVSRDELERMKASILPPAVDRARDLKKAHLKQLSNEKMKNWPNTLEALRKKKESFLKEKEELAEQKRREIDQEEAEIRKQTRLAAIERANKLLYEQTDNMKYLRSQELYSDCLYDRTFQVKEKQKRVEDNKLERAQFHQTILEKVKRGEQEEREKEELIKKKTQEVKVARQVQLEEMREIRRKEAEEQRQIGLEMKRQAELQVEREIQMRKEKAERIAKSNEEMVSANEQLKIIRDEVRAQEQREIDRREAEVEIIENRKKVRKALEIRKFEKAQVKRQQIIEAATRALSDQSAKHEALTLKQANEYKEKEDKAFADKEEKRRREWELTVQSRQQQIADKKVRDEIERQKEQELLDYFEKSNKIGLEKELEKQRKAREATIKCKAEQYELALQRQHTKVDEKVNQIEKDRHQLSHVGDEDEKFREICLQEIEKYRAAGKPLYPLYKALEHKQPDLLAVSGFRI